MGNINLMTTKDENVYLHPTKSTNGVSNYYEKCFDSIRCAPRKPLSKFINERNGKHVFL